MCLLSDCVEEERERERGAVLAQAASGSSPEPEGETGEQPGRSESQCRAQRFEHYYHLVPLRIFSFRAVAGDIGGDKPVR